MLTMIWYRFTIDRSPAGPYRYLRLGEILWQHTDIWPLSHTAYLICVREARQLKKSSYISCKWTKPCWSMKTIIPWKSFYTNQFTSDFRVTSQETHCEILREQVWCKFESYRVGQPGPSTLSNIHHGWILLKLCIYYICSVHQQDPYCLLPSVSSTNARQLSHFLSSHICYKTRSLKKSPMLSLLINTTA